MKKHKILLEFTAYNEFFMLDIMANIVEIAQKYKVKDIVTEDLTTGVRFEKKKG